MNGGTRKHRFGCWGWQSAVALLAVGLSGCQAPGLLRWPQGSPTVAGAAGPALDDGVVPAASRATAGLVVPPAVPGPDHGEFPLDLTDALRLAEAENPLIAGARQRIGSALALQQGARALLLPSLNAGLNYHAHSGDLQRSSGRILSLNEQSLYLGGGSRALAAESVGVPAVNLASQLTEAFFEPLAARQEVAGARFHASATANSILREVAECFTDLQAAGALLALNRATADQAAEVARLTADYARAGQGRDADAERAATELSLIVREVQEAEGGVAVASARLARRLHLDPGVRVRPAGPLTPLTLVAPDAPQTELIQAALRRRPEIGARSAAIAAAETRHREERYRPLLPTLWLGFSGGAMGGGSNLAPPALSHFGGRTDFDARVFWTLQNFGAGNLARQKGRWAEVGEAVGERARVIAAVRTEVSEALAAAAAARRQVDVTRNQLRSAELGFREDVERIRNTVGRPVEVVNSLSLLNQARIDHVRAIADQNKAQFRLFVALGSPPPLGRPATDPLPPAPLASPALPPLAARPASEAGRTR